MAAPARPSVLRSALVAAALTASAWFASAGPCAAAGPGTYEIVDLQGQAYAATSLVFTADGIRAAVPGGVRTLQAASVDWYETFYRNIKAGVTNVVAFRNGSLLRFDRFELKDGNVVLTVGGGQVQLAESLIDFAGSVREGAMVKLPEGAGASVQVSRSTGGSWTDDSGDGEEPGAAASRRRGARIAPSRRGALGAPPAAPEDGTVTMPEEAMEPGDMVHQEEESPPPSGSSFGRGNKGSGFGNNPGGIGNNNGNTSGNGGETPDGSPAQSGQAVVRISTDYSGPIGGLQVLLQYPPALQVVERVAFTGFAANWMATPNTTVAGQINIGGIADPGTSISGGEFLRVTFVWQGTPPSRQQFRIASLTASGETSETLPDFRTTMEVEISP